MFDVRLFTGNVLFVNHQQYKKLKELDEVFRNLCLLFLSLFVLIACDEETKKEKEVVVKNSDETTVVDKSENEEEETKAKVEKESKQTKKEKEELLAKEQKAKEAVVLGILYDNFEDSMDIRFTEDTKTFEFLSNDPQFTLDLYGLLDGTVDISEWDGMVESFRGMSESSMGILGAGYGMTLINPVNTDNYLLYIVDGIVVYDAFHE